jgi:phosphinothricin acetyltransferase
VINVRPARPDDARAIAAIYAPYVTDGVISFEADPPDTAEMARRMTAGGDRYPWLVAEDGHAVVGYSYAAPFHRRAAYGWAVETTVYVAGDAHRRGVGRALYTALLDGLTRQGFTRAIGVIALPHPASVALHEAFGFRLVGVNEAVGYKHGRWIDVGIWQRALATPNVPPEPVRSALPGS